MKPKLIMVGACPYCGKEYERSPPVDAAACLCKSPDAVLVPLVPAFVLPSSLYKRYARIAELAGVSVERLVSEMLKEAARQKLKEMKSLPQITVTTRS